MKIKNERKDVFKRGQSIVGKLRRYTKNYSKKFDDILESSCVDDDTKKMIKETVVLMEECCSFSDSYLALEKQRTMQLNRMESNIELIKGLLEAKE